MRRTALLATTISAAAALAVTAERPALGQQADAPVSAAYTAACAGCHGPSMAGAFAPSLVNPAFKAKWEVNFPNALAQYIHANMPPADPGSVSRAAALELAAEIGRANGLVAGAPEAVASAGNAPPADKVADRRAQESAEGGVANAILNKDSYYQQEMGRRAQRLAAVTPVTKDMLRSPPPGDWLSVARTHDGLAFSPLQDINRDNVAQLSLAWSVALPSGTNGITPIVHDGVMFINSSGVVKALDVVSGDELWSFDRAAEVMPLGPPVSQPRGMAIYDNMPLVPTIDNHLVALDIRSGKIIWDRLIEKPGLTLRISAPPMVVNGKIIQGMAGCAGAQELGGCFVVALDAKSGAELWRFYTIPRKSDPGFDTWNKAPSSQRFGGSIWTAPTYDEQTGLIYVGTAQTYHVKPLMKAGGTRAGKRALYTNSTLALVPDTGKLAWFYQHMDREVWDLDWSFERQVFTMKTASGPRRVVSTLGKLGIMDVLDARSGKYLTSFDMGMQNLVTAIDPKTGLKTTDPKLEPEAGAPKHICPFAGGVRNWPFTSLDIQSDTLFVPFTKSCMTFLYKPEQDLDISYGMAPPDDNDGDLGGVMAIDMTSLKPIWVQKQRAPASSGTLATAGKVVFAGDRDRWFRALDSETGKVLWSQRLDRRLSSNPITFAYQGKQYVSITSGGGAPNDATQESLTPEATKTAPGVTLWVFQAK